ncbi:MAG: DUF2612 domain-containing protein [Lachnospiraceae bacterium]|nr:DUF2612 domain-containing protein [Lachnospiraceae bacterium]
MNELLEYYPNLLEIQYHNGFKAKSTIEAYVRLLWANQILKQIRDAFEIDTAVGQQLDFIGAWVGVDRYTDKRPYDDHPWIALPELTGATSIWQGGFSEIDNFNTELGGFLTDYYAVGKVSYLLNDEVYRYLIKLKIIKNSISHTCKNIDDAIYKFSNNEVWTRWDVPNRTLYYECNKRYQQLFSLSIALKKNVLPCPTGYKIEINIIEEST